MTSSSPGTTQQRLQHFRNNLLKLHKLLLESERARYEQANGPIKNKGEFFQLVISDDAFSWLRPISKFIVQIDEFTSAKQENTALISETDSLKTQLTADKEAVQAELSQTVSKLSSELESNKRELDEAKHVQLLKQQVNYITSTKAHTKLCSIGMLRSSYPQNPWKMKIDGYFAVFFFF